MFPTRVVLDTPTPALVMLWCHGESGIKWLYPVLTAGGRTYVPLSYEGEHLSAVTVASTHPAPPQRIKALLISPCSRNRYTGNAAAIHRARGVKILKPAPWAKRASGVAAPPAMLSNGMCAYCRNLNEGCFADAEPPLIPAR